MTGFQEASLFEGGLGQRSTLASDLETFEKKRLKFSSHEE